MYMTCKRCENKHFLVDIKRQEGKEDTYEFVCAGCGDCVETLEMNDYQTYLVKEIDKRRNRDESICLEEWVEEGAVVYYVSLYKDEELIGYKDFSTVDDASNCYKKCTDIFDSLGSLDTVVKLFDDC
jgi:hypothetical protein